MTQDIFQSKIKVIIVVTKHKRQIKAILYAKNN